MTGAALPRGSLIAGLVLGVFAAGCAARMPPAPPEPIAPKYPAFVFPAPPDAGDPVTGDRQVRGWRFLQTGDLRNAEREFTEGARRHGAFAPAEAGLGYVALARGDLSAALDWFGRALRAQADYAPALVGRGEVLLAQARYVDALRAFEAAAIADTGLDLGSRVQVLRLRVVQEHVATARRALELGDLAAARSSYDVAIAASPESGFLHRELAAVERREGRLEQAADRYRTAAGLDPSDTRAHIGLGESLEASGDPAGALSAYEAAWAIEPSAALDARIARLRARIAADALPSRYRQIERTSAITRGDLAALLGVRMGTWLEGSAVRTRLVTDVHEHWAAPWIARVVDTGLMEPYPNHTFQPDLEITRGDLAAVVSRALDLLARLRPESAPTWRTAAPAVVDVPRTHLAYPAVAQAVGAGVLSLSGGAFEPSRRVSGAEARDAVERLRALAGPAPLPMRP